MVMKTQEGIKERYARVAGTLDERGRRAVAASEALALGWGGITAVVLVLASAWGLVPSAVPGGTCRQASAAVGVPVDSGHEPDT